MTDIVIIMIIIGVIIIFASYFLSEKMTNKKDEFNIELLTADENYELSKKELSVTGHKVEDVIAKQVKDILLETNETLTGMVDHKIQEIENYTTASYEEINKKHKEVLFLYDMLDEKQKEIKNTVKTAEQIAQNLEQEAAKYQQMILDEGIEQNTEKKDTMKQNAKKQELEKQDSVKQNAEKQELEKQDSVKQNAEKQELEKQDSVKQNAEKQERKKQDSVKLDAEKKNLEKQDTVELDTEKQELEKQEATKRGIEKQNTTKQDSTSNKEHIMTEPKQIESVTAEEKGNAAAENREDSIVEMHRKGTSILDIAKQLGLGVGEVKQVIDSHQGEKK